MGTARDVLGAAWEGERDGIDVATSYDGGRSGRRISERFADLGHEDPVVASRAYWRTRAISRRNRSRKATRSEIDA